MASNHCLSANSSDSSNRKERSDIFLLKMKISFFFINQTINHNNVKIPKRLDQIRTLQTLLMHQRKRFNNYNYWNNF